MSEREDKQRRLIALIDGMRQAALQADWATFDSDYRAAMTEASASSSCPPVEPTEAMIQAAIAANPIQNNEVARITIRRMWKAMLAVPESETPKEVLPVAMTLERYHEFLAYEAECKLRDARSSTAAPEAVALAEQWKGRADDCGRLARAVLDAPRSATAPTSSDNSPRGE